MKIKVIKTTLAAENQLGNSIKEYKEGEIYEIFDELAQVFVNENWGIEAIEEKAIEAPENKGIEVAPENKSFKKKKESAE